MSRELQKKLKGRWETFTPSEQKIAAYLLRNLSGIPFETAASLGQRVGVSAMTVGRFLRNLGYAGVGALKEELRGDTTWLQLYKTPEPPKDGDFISEHLHAEIRSLNDVHALAKGAEWRPIVKLLASADRVSVASFQLGRSLGETLALLLQQIRPEVSFHSGVDGSYSDLLIDSTPRSCVVLVDERRYSRHFRILAEEVAERGIPLVIITDTQCYWAHQLTRHALMLPIHAGRSWHSFSAFVSLFSLLMSAVTRELGDAVYERIEAIDGLRQQFIGFSGPALGDRRQSARGAPRGRRSRKTD